MRVQAISVPSVARSTEFGSAGMFMAGGREVTASTLRNNPYGGGWAAPGQVAVWLAVPVARDLLLAAWMLDGLSYATLADVNAMSDDDLRERAIHQLVMEGTLAAQDEIGTEAFESGYRTEGAEIEHYAAVVAARLDRAFFGPATADVTVPEPRPASDPAPAVEHVERPATRAARHLVPA